MARRFKQEFEKEFLISSLNCQIILKKRNPLGLQLILQQSRKIFRCQTTLIIGHHDRLCKPFGYGIKTSVSVWVQPNHLQKHRKP